MLPSLLDIAFHFLGNVAVFNNYRESVFNFVEE